MLCGENTKKIYRLGDKVRVQVVRVDMERRQIDLGLVDMLDAVRAATSAARGPDAQLGAAEEAEQRKGTPEQRRKREAARREEGSGRTRTASDEDSRRSCDECSIVVGTAGHIDHGKSALVRALTGIDPDRLKEEKARGITIELGLRAHRDRRHARRVRRRARATSGSSRPCSPASAASTACCWSSPPTNR